MPVLFRALCLAGLTVCGAAAAQPVEVDLQLVLAVDVSRSMDADEQRLQRLGYVEAFRHPAVIKAIQAGVIGRIAVTYVQWAGAGLQEVVVPWSLVDGAASAAAFADRLAAVPLIAWRRTSISGGLDFSAGLFEGSSFRSEPRVIDISGDGPNNAGATVTLARDRAVAAGIVINGLPVLLKTGRGIGFFDIDRLDRYYEDCVIGGFGAFIVSVREAAEFATAIRRKLILEIAGARPHLVPAQARAPEERMDCLIGEKLWQEFMRGRE
jgi:hypothetical protein